MIDEQIYYICEFRLRGRKHYVAWYSGEKDGLLLNENKRISSFSSPAKLMSYAEQHDLAISSGPASIFDFDLIESWCGNPQPMEIDCDNFLNVWNMISDITSSTGGSPSFSSADKFLNGAYEKLFHGNNLLIAPDEEPYSPVWSSGEVKALASLFSAGLRELYASISA